MSLPEEGRATHIREGFEVVRDLLLRRYPAFVTGGQLPRGQIPVFVFHGVQPDSFDRQLAYLARNHYQTLSADQYLRILTGDRPAPERALVLTFDDGNGSLWSVGLPLLKRYGMKAVVFLVPGRIDSRPHPLPPTLDDVSQGKATREDILRRDHSDQPYLSWEEIEAMSAAGLFDFESHTFSHGRVHVSPVLQGFLSPSSRRGPAAMDVPLIREGDRDLLAHHLPLGTPLYRSESRLGESLRFLEDGARRKTCTAHVAEAGNERFFERPDWRRELSRVHGKGPLGGELETPQQRDDAIEWELARSKAAIEERTGREVLHLCFPWHVAGPTARRLAREVGYRMAFGGKVRDTAITPIGGDLWTIARIGEDFLELLPGKDRSSLASVLRAKTVRRWRRAWPFQRNAPG